ncbi:class I SAM-dependent methyltransferase [Chengkuizengella marina]|uniref:class I SAM-dependent methyltransferase n=1 Tax=Chengkuizengella marina TaxID=2507566 RepID=UPI00191C3DF9|nr:class I SAM-dependent methyltransferase [Chengkuizengella marina]
MENTVVFPYSEHDFNKTELAPSYRVELRDPRNEKLDKFIKANVVSDWSELNWEKIGKPYIVNKMSVDRLNWEKENKQDMSVKTSWEFFNRSFHEWFIKDVPSEMSEKKKAFTKSLSKFNTKDVKTALGDIVKLNLWNYVHRVQDGIWDPRGKRALFEGLDVKKPRILFLGAAEGYEAMQLAAMYPGAEVVLVDYDEYCKTHRFEEFPTSYPFLGENPSTGSAKVWYKDEMNIEYEVEDIRNLNYGKEFDIVLSVGLLEHAPDEYKSEMLDMHRRFLKPGGYVIMTTPRNQIRSRIYYNIMADVMNHMYRELMDIRQMGLYVYEAGFDIIRHGFIKVHNGIIAQVR